MLEDRFKDNVTLKIPAGVIVDGKELFAEHAAKSLIMDFSFQDINYFGQIKNGKIFLLKSAHEPLAGSKITHAGKTYDLQAVKTCRDLDGRIECYRCAVAG
jgi:hypothetical protein